MVKRLSFMQWTLAYTQIYESAGDPMKLVARLDPTFGLKVLPDAPAGAAAGTTDHGAPPVPDPVVDENNLCVVCMERPPKIVLPCGHSFCQECISEWFAILDDFYVLVAVRHTWNTHPNTNRKGRSDTCPVCRASVTASGADEWVMAGEPSPTELAQYITEFLSSLDDKTFKKGMLGRRA